MKLTRISALDMPYTDNLFQSGFWATVCEGEGIESICFHVDPGDENPCFSLVAVVRTGVSGDRYAYVPRGPEIDLAEFKRGPFLEDLSHSLADELTKNCACIRYDTPFHSPYTDSEFWTSTGQWKGAPRKEIREIRMNYGTLFGELRKSPLDHLSPDTVIISLQGSEDDLLARMRQTTRNSIRRAYRNGLEFKTEGVEGLASWYPLYADTARRKHFFYEEISYFTRLFELRDSFATSGASTAETNAPNFYILTAMKDGECLAGLILGVMGQRGYYLYAGSSMEKRECMPNYGLQWEAIRLLRSLGCRNYDLMGVPPNGDPGHSMYGLYTFKTGLGGKVVHYSGCWDYPIDSARYTHFKNAENIGGL